MSTCHIRSEQQHWSRKKKGTVATLDNYCRYRILSADFVERFSESHNPVEQELNMELDLFEPRDQNLQDESEHSIEDGLALAPCELVSVQEHAQAVPHESELCEENESDHAANSYSGHSAYSLAHHGNSENDPDSEEDSMLAGPSDSHRPRAQRQL
eukprot:593255-Rhodomonas_salina.1